jgi:uncharacterized membrane protein
VAGRFRTGTRLDPKFAAALAYVGGALSGILFLIVEKKDPFVRFHAMQSTITFLAVLVMYPFVMSVPVVGRPLSWTFVIAIGVLWAFLIFKAFMGERYKLPYVGAWAEEQMK